MKVRLRIPTNNHLDRELSRWLIWAASYKWDALDLSSIDITYNVWGPDRARNQLVEEFLASEDTHLWMIDDDVVPPRHFGILTHAEHYPIVSGLYYGFHKDLGRFPHSYSRGTMGFVPDYRPLVSQDPYKADAVGLGCCVFHRSVFEDMPPGEQGAWFQVVWADGQRIGEDLNFFMSRTDIRPLVVPRYPCQHIKDMAL